MIDLKLFLKAIKDAPDDPGPKLAYADACFENGDYDRSEFIQLQHRGENVERQKELLAANARVWIGQKFSKSMILWRSWADDLSFWKDGFLHRWQTHSALFFDLCKFVFDEHPTIQLVQLSDSPRVEHRRWHKGQWLASANSCEDQYRFCFHGGWVAVKAPREEYKQIIAALFAWHWPGLKFVPLNVAGWLDPDRSIDELLESDFADMQDAVVRRRYDEFVRSQMEWTDRVIVGDGKAAEPLGIFSVPSAPIEPSLVSTPANSDELLEAMREIQESLGVPPDLVGDPQDSNYSSRKDGE